MRRTLLLAALGLSVGLSLGLAAPLAAADDVEEVAEVEAPTQIEATTIQADDHIMGSADAPHNLVIYASVTCGHCGAWFTKEWPRVKELVDDGQLRVAFREVPTSPAQVSMAGFMIANCGPEDAFFDSVVSQMERQDEMRELLSTGKGQDYFVSLGEQIGLSTEDEIKACFEKEEVFTPIDLSMRRFEAAGGSGVPAFFLDGEKLDGKHDADAILALTGK